MKPWLGLLMILGFLFALASCQRDIIAVDMETLVEEKYGVEVVQMYATTQINPDDPDEPFIHLTREMRRTLKSVRHADPCNLAWLSVSYIKTNEGDHLVFHVAMVNRIKDLKDAVFMIDYPYEYTVTDMKAYLMSLDLESPLLIDFETFAFSLQYKHAPVIHPEPSAFDRLFNRSCFVMIVSTNNHLNPDFHPAATLNSAFVWIFNAKAQTDEETGSTETVPLWFQQADFVQYRVYVKDGVVYVTMASMDVPETYIHPMIEPVA